MNILEYLNKALDAREITPEQYAERLRNHEKNADPNSHLHGGLFKQPAPTLIIGDTEEAPRDTRQRMRRTEKISQVFEQAFMGAIDNRVKDAHGPGIVKVSFKEWQKMQGDPDVKTVAQYLMTLTHYCGVDGQPDPDKPRATPIRPLLQNEVGTWGDKIVILKDAGPDDVGEGAYFQVKEQLTKPEGT